jgi:hypothetical protein
MSCTINNALPQDYKLELNEESLVGGKKNIINTIKEGFTWALASSDLKLAYSYDRTLKR